MLLKHSQAALSKVDYSMGEGICMLPSNMNLNIRSGTAGYNNEILVSDDGFSLGKNDMVNASAPTKLSHKTPIVPKHGHKDVLPLPKHTSAIRHEQEKITLVLIPTSAFGIWYAFQ